MIKYTYYGHASFLLDDGTSKVLADPFLTGNPLAAIKASEVECDYILLTHAHSDHLGVPEVLAVCLQAESDIKTHGMNIGGSIKLPFGKVRMTMALHSSGVAGGIACGYVIHIGDINVYFAGDTALFSDMKLIGQKDPLDYAVLPIGDNYTMGLEDAALAAQWLNTRNVIPVHYNTWPVIAQEAKRYKEVTEGMTRAAVHVIEPGGTLELA